MVSTSAKNPIKVLPIEKERLTSSLTLGRQSPYFHHQWDSCFLKVFMCHTCKSEFLLFSMAHKTNITTFLFILLLSFYR